MIVEWPRNSLIVTRSAPPSSRWVANPNSNQALVGKTVFVTLFNGRRVEGRVTAMLNTVAGVKYRVVSGDLLFQVSREQLVAFINRHNLRGS
jgi:hypothetical protein